MTTAILLQLQVYMLVDPSFGDFTEIGTDIKEWDEKVTPQTIPHFTTVGDVQSGDVRSADVQNEESNYVLEYLERKFGIEETCPRSGD